MSKPTCAEAAKFYNDLVEARSEFETLFLLAGEFDFTKDKQIFRNVMNKKAEMENYLKEYEKNFGAAIRIVDFAGDRLYQDEAAALDEVIWEIEEALTSEEDMQDLRRVLDERDYVKARIIYNNRYRIERNHVVSLNLINLNIANLPNALIEGKLPDLKRLSVEMTLLYNMSQFSNLPNLELLFIGNRYEPSGIHLDALKELKKLKHLEVVGVVRPEERAEFIEYWTKRLGDDFHYAEHY